MTAAALVPVVPVERLRAELDAALDPYLAARIPLYVETAAVATSLAVTTAGTLAAADALLASVMQEIDGLEAVRESGPGALGSLVRSLNAKFKPLRDELEKARDHLKAQIGAYTIAQRAAQVENYQAAAQAHVAGDHEGAAVALAAASAAETSAPAGTSVREVWAVKRYAPELMLLDTDEHAGLVPNVTRIERIARETPIHETPVVAGVVFEKVPAVSKRRK